MKIIEESYAKVSWAKKRIDSIGDIRAFDYFCDISPQKMCAYFYAKERNPGYIDFGNECTSIISMLSIALETAYFGIVSRFVDKSKFRYIYFPRSNSREEWVDKCRKNFANCVSEGFFQDIVSFENFPEGNKALYLMGEINNIGKHRHNCPLKYSAFIYLSDLYLQVPELIKIFDPRSEFKVSGNKIDMQMPIDITKVSQDIWDADRSGVYKRILDIKALAGYDVSYGDNVVDDLNDFVLISEKVLSILSKYY